MFEHLSRYDKILVTGPQRSGTRIAAKMVAHDTSFEYVDEDMFGVRELNLFEQIMEWHQIAVQCPTMSHCIHKYTDDETLVVFMIRDVEDIIASERRIDWHNGPYFELMNYGYSSRQAVSFRRRGGHVAPIKYAYWLTKQRRHIPHYLELEYESLAAHPLWIPKEQRVNFTTKQTELA